MKKQAGAVMNGLKDKPKAEVKKEAGDALVTLKGKQSEIGKKKPTPPPAQLEEEEEDEDDEDDMLEFESDEDDDDEEDMDEETFKRMLASGSKAKDSKGERVKGKMMNFGDDDDDDDDDDEEDDDDDDEDDTDEEEPSPVVSKPKNAKIAKKETPDLSKLGKMQSKTPVPAPAPTPDKSASKQQVASPGTAKKVHTKGGVIIEDVKVGQGPVAKNGKMATVYYTGKLKNNNRVFDKNLSGKGFQFRIGLGEVIKGWDIGVEGMKVGGKRKMVIPASLGYGKRGAPPDIPPGATLVFEVELKNVS